MPLMDKECQECIKLFGHEEMRCAFCKDKGYFKEFLEESKYEAYEGIN